MGRVGEGRSSVGGTRARGCRCPSASYRMHTLPTTVCIRCLPLGHSARPSTPSPLCPPHPRPSQLHSHPCWGRVRAGAGPRGQALRGLDPTGTPYTKQPAHSHARTPKPAHLVGHSSTPSVRPVQSGGGGEQAQRSGGLTAETPNIELTLNPRCSALRPMP